MDILSSSSTVSYKLITDYDKKNQKPAVIIQQTQLIRTLKPRQDV
jgi:hypothetical protein